MRERDYTKTLLIFVFIGLALCLRAISLDKDIPNLHLAMYAPYDEGPYAMQSIRFARPNLVNAVESLGTEGLKEYNSSICFLLTLFTTVSLKLFGNNYYGLRMGSIVASLIISILVLMIIWKYVDGKKRRVFALFAGLIIAFNFSFLLASRIVEPSIFRSLLIMLVGAWVFFEKDDDRNYLVLGVLSTLSIIWGYVTNIFIFIPSVILLIEELVTEKSKGAKAIIHFIGGAIVSYTVGEGIMYLVQGRTFLQDTIRVAIGQETWRVTISIGSIVDNVKRIMQTNMFAYNITFLVLSFIGVIYCLYTGIKERSRQKLWVSTTVIAFFLQSLFTSDFLYRKCIVIFPILLLSIVIFFAEEGFYEHRKCVIALSTLILLPGIFGEYLRINGLDNSDMTADFKILLYCIFGISFFLMAMGFVCRKKVMIVLVAMAVILPDLCMDYAYIVKADKSEKRAMMELGEILGDNYVLGWGYSYCLYNNIIPASNFYDSYYSEEYTNRNQMLFETKKVIYWLGTKDSGDIYLEGTRFKWELKKRLFTDYNYFPGENYEIYIYELREK